MDCWKGSQIKNRETSGKNMGSQELRVQDHEKNVFHIFINVWNPNINSLLPTVVKIGPNSKKISNLTVGKL